jgi:RNA polymerase sigma-70 factor (sigma-E family)
VIDEPTCPEAAVGNLEAAYDAHYLALLRLAVLLTARQEAAEDLVQESFVKAADRIQSLPVGEAKPYLRATLLNLWRNTNRRRAVERRHLQQMQPDRDGSFEDAMVLWDAVAKLPPKQRACLVLRFYEDLPVRQTAELLHCSQGTVKSQTSKAIEKLRQGWEA